MSIDFIVLYIFMFILGAVFGSFACCQAWRIHEAKTDRKLSNRSVCMSCNHKLAWYDNIPVISWLFLRGRCRYCKQKIGVAEIFSELGLGLAFTLIVLKYTCALPSVTALFSMNPSFFLQPLLLLVSMIVFWILLVYDAKWGELPVFLMLIMIILAVSYQLVSHGDLFQITVTTGFLAGIYYLLYFFSKERLVGGGDWILCISIAIVLGRFEFAIIELFLANFTATLAAAPSALRGQKKQIPFGPFLILSLLAILLASDYLIRFLVIY